MLYQDRPESASVKFGHTAVAKWLAELLQGLPTPFRLAVTGGLGTGKSTIVHEALSQLGGMRKSGKTKLVYVDVWKLDRESVRRSAILRIAKELKIEVNSIQKLRETLYGSYSGLSKFGPFSKIDGTPLFVALGLGALTVFVVYLILNILSPNNSEWIKFLVSIGVAAIGLATRFLEKSIVHVQRTFTRPPLVGAEEFEECLQELIDLEDEGTLIVLVFDNIDRSSPDASKAILTGLSAFFDHSAHSRPRNVIILVPFDRNNAQVKDQSDRSFLQDSEKMFDAIVPLPQLLEEDLFDYALDLFKGAFLETYGEEICRDMATLAKFSSYQNPRELKHLVNEVICQLSLATKMENASELRLAVDEPFLTKGSVTDHPVFLAKLVICNRIFFRFSGILIENSLDVQKLFNSDEPSFHGDDTEIDPKLLQFLRSTRGLPKNCPFSVVPFHYLKGPDVVLSIPSGPVISSSLLSGDSKRLIELANSTEHSQFIESVFRVFEYHRSKYTNQPQALKNGIQALLAFFKEKPEQASSVNVTSLAQTINIVPDLLAQVSPAHLHSLTVQCMEHPDVLRLWRRFDSIHRENLSEIGQITKKNEELWNWTHEYLESVFVQKDGLSRAGVSDKSFTFELLTSERIFKAIGADYPSDFASPSCGILAAIQLCNLDLNSVSFEICRKIVASKLPLVNELSGSQQLLQELAEAWSHAASSWLSSSTDVSVDGLALVVRYLSKDQKFVLPYYNAIRQWVKTHQSQLTRKAQAEGASSILDFGMAFCFNSSSEVNMNSIVQASLQAVSRAGWDSFYSKWESSVVWNTLRGNSFSQALLQAIDRIQIFDLVFRDGSEELQIWVCDSIASFANREALLVSAANNAETFLGNHTVVSRSQALIADVQRVAFVKLQKAMKNEFESFVDSIKLFISQPLEDTDALIGVVRQEYSVGAIAIMEAAKELIQNSPTTWRQAQVSQLKWAVFDTSNLTHDRVARLVDTALERGVIGGANVQLQKDVLIVVMGLWRDDVGFDERQLKVLEGHKIPDPEVNEWIAEVKTQYGISKKGFLGKMLEKIE